MANLLRPLLIIVIFLGILLTTWSSTCLLWDVLYPFESLLGWFEALEDHHWGFIAELGTWGWVAITLLSDAIQLFAPLILSVILTRALLRTHTAPNPDPC
jgi:hypothetical protein